MVVLIITLAVLIRVDGYFFSLHIGISICNKITWKYLAINLLLVGLVVLISAIMVVLIVVVVVLTTVVAR